MKSFMYKIVPGLTISILVAITSQFLATFFPAIGSAVISILLGIVVGNTIFTHPSFQGGTRFSEKYLLEFAIVLNGLTLSLQMMQGIGFSGVLFILLHMSLTIVAAYSIGRFLGFSKVFTLLMGAGNAVCGTAAIGTVAPVLDADSKEKGMSITTVNVMGTFLMMGLPLLATLLYQQAVIPTSALIGGVVQSVGQVVASAKLVNDSVVNLATVFKLLRVVMIAAVALLFGKLNLNEGEPLFKSASQEDSNVQVKFRIPWFIIGFLLLFVVRSLDVLPASLIETTSSIRSQLEITALAAIGMRVRLAEFIKEGPKVIAYGAIVSIFQVLLAVLLIQLFF